MPDLLAIRGRALARREKHADAVATAEKLVSLDQKDGNAIYGAAGMYSLCAANGEKQLQENYAARAVELLKSAQGLGYFKDPGDCIDIQYNHNFDPLRGRDDFKKLLAEVTPSHSVIGSH